LNESFEGFSRRHRDGLFSAISAGFFFILVGAIFLTTPNLYNQIINFFNDFGLVRVPNLGNVFLPAPLHPFSLTNRAVYSAVEQFSYVWGLFQLVILALRFLFRSTLKKDAETVSNIVSWVGTGFLIRTFLIETIRLSFITGMTRWFVFWAAIIMLLGVSLIIRAIILLAAASTRHIN
jgi:hypothetical protein